MGVFAYSSKLHQALAHYRRLLKNQKGNRKRRGAVTLEAWSESFLRKDVCTTQYARLSDPFLVGSHMSETSFNQRFEPEGGVSARHILARDIDEELSLVAFIATWICYFVLPGKNRIFRPSTLLMASLIARGERIALAPAMLAYLYHGLGQVSAMTDSRRYDVEAPWHYLHGWIYMHVSGSFSCPETPQFFKEQRYPIIMQLSKATAAVDIAQIRTFMFAPSRMTDRFQIIHQSRMQNLSAQCIDHRFTDSVTERNTPLLLSKPSYQSITEYLIGIRPSWLCYRRHESVILKEYHPNRVARQFGFTQATPLYGLPQIPGVGDVRTLGTSPLSTRLEAASMAWAFLFRLGTGSHFYVAPRCAHTGVSHFWLLWIRHTFSSFLDMGFRVYSRRLRKPKHAGSASSVGESSEKEDNHEQHRRSSSAHRSHRPPAYPEPIQKRRRDASLPAHQSPIRDEPSLLNEEPNRDVHPSPSNHDNVMTDTPESTHHSLPILSEGILSESIMNEVMPVESADVSTVSPIHYSAEPSTDESLEEFDVANTTDEFSQTSSIQGVTTSTPVASTTASISETGGQSLPHSRNILEPSSGLEMSLFITNIPARNASFPQGRLSKSLNHIMAALRELLLDVNVETLPGLASFCTEANSLLDCAAATGFSSQELQQWESILRNIEFALFTIQTAQENMPSEIREYVEATFNVVSEKTTAAYEDLQSRLRTMKMCQKEISCANMETFRISAELRKLQYKRQYLIQRRNMIRQAVNDMEEDCSRINVEVSELEQTFSALSHKKEIASHRLQYVNEEHGVMIDQAQAAVLYIKEIQTKHM